MMDAGDIEGAAEWLYRVAGFDSREPVAPAKLAKALLGHGAIRTVHRHALKKDAALAVVHGAPRIFVRSGLDLRRRNFAICHELAEWHLGEIRYCEPDVEQVADALAAALLAPRQLFLLALREDGVKFPLLAARFAATQSCAALRFGETTNTPLVLVAPREVRVRGAPWGWPQTEEQLRKLAKLPPIPGMRRDVLSDEPKRVVLRVA
ncbi:MAG TPA: ImmA/IrrE family metallo-endopeptidase [Polyangiaceae bacterium]|jgi:hypothetical protein